MVAAMWAARQNMLKAQALAWAAKHEAEKPDPLVCVPMIGPLTSSALAGGGDHQGTPTIKPARFATISE